MPLLGYGVSYNYEYLYFPAVFVAMDRSLDITTELSSYQNGGRYISCYFFNMINFSLSHGTGSYTNTYYEVDDMLGYSLERTDQYYNSQKTSFEVVYDKDGYIVSYTYVAYNSNGSKDRYSYQVVKYDDINTVVNAAAFESALLADNYIKRTGETAEYANSSPFYCDTTPNTNMVIPHIGTDEYQAKLPQSSTGSYYFKYYTEIDGTAYFVSQNGNTVTETTRQPDYLGLLADKFDRFTYNEEGGYYTSAETFQLELDGTNYQYSNVKLYFMDGKLVKSVVTEQAGTAAAKAKAFVYYSHGLVNGTLPQFNIPA